MGCLGTGVWSAHSGPPSQTNSSWMYVQASRGAMEHHSFLARVPHTPARPTAVIKGLHSLYVHPHPLRLGSGAAVVMAMCIYGYCVWSVTPQERLFLQPRHDTHTVNMVHTKELDSASGTVSPMEPYTHDTMATVTSSISASRSLSSMEAPDTSQLSAVTQLAAATPQPQTAASELKQFKHVNTLFYHGFIIQLRS